MPRFEYVFFDFDGTIVDTGPGIMRCVQYALSRLGIDERDEAKLRAFVGPPLQENFRVSYSLSEQQAADAVRYYREEYVGKGVFESQLYAGASEQIARLHDAGLCVAIASNKPEDMITQLCSLFGIDTLISGISGLRGKAETKATAIGRLLSEFAIADPRRVVMVGDRAVDAEGAQQCGTAFVAALYGYGPRQEFAGYPVDFFAETAPQIGDYILA